MNAIIEETFDFPVHGQGEHICASIRESFIILGENMS